MSEEPLAAHSLTEAHFYLMSNPCGSCGSGPLKGPDKQHSLLGPSDDPFALLATCVACNAETTVRFSLVDSIEDDAGQDPPRINSTDDPSRIIDLGQWITLFRTMVESAEAEAEADKTRKRRGGLVAAQCLAEALKFYDEPGNDLPPPEALWTETSQRRFREHPEQFSRRRLIELRSKLPTSSVMRSRLGGGKSKRWWQWWR